MRYVYSSRINKDVNIKLGQTRHRFELSGQQCCNKRNNSDKPALWRLTRYSPLATRPRKIVYIQGPLRSCKLHSGKKRKLFYCNGFPMFQIYSKVVVHFAVYLKHCGYIFMHIYFTHNSLYIYTCIYSIPVHTCMHEVKWSRSVVSDSLGPCGL